MASQSNGHQPDLRADSALLAVSDVNEYKQKYRLDEILNAMTKIAEQADHARSLYVAGQVDMDGRRQMLFWAVKNAIWECLELLNDHERKRVHQAEDDDYEGLGHSEYLTGVQDDPLGTIELTRSEDIVVWGLKDYFELEELWTETWTETVKHRNMPAKSVEKSVTHTVPRALSWRAARRLKEFLNVEHDIEVKFQAVEQDVHAEVF